MDPGGWGAGLPVPATALVGRGREIDEIVDRVHAHRLVTLTGVGGAGKTRLAIEVAGRLEDEFRDGVWFVELAAVADGEAVPDALATALGVSPRADVSVADAIAETLAGRRVLVVLDNCEHVVDAVAPLVEVILGRSATPRVVATSREGLRAAGEVLVPVGPLGLDGGAAAPAVALFVERARAVVPTFAPDGDAADAVAGICRDLDGLALGIELAAAWMVSLTPEDLRARLVADRFRMLTGPPHQRGLRETVEWSYRLLDVRRQRVLVHASVFAGGFDLDALADVLGGDDPLDVLHDLDALVRASLVTTSRDAGTVRYGMLETIRAFAGDELAVSGGLEEARDRHAAHFAREVVARWEIWHGPGFHAAVDWVTAEHDNLRAGFRWSVARGDLSTAADIAAHTAMIGVAAERFEAVGWAAGIADAVEAAALPRAARVRTAAAYCCFTGSPEAAVVHAQVAQRLGDAPGADPFDPGWPRFIEALAQVYCGHVDRYVARTAEVAALGGSAAAYGLPGLVDGLQATGRVDEALALVGDAVAAARDQGNPWLIAYAGWVGGTALAHTDRTQALDAWADALEYLRAERITFFEGFVTRDAGLLRLADAGADATVSIDLFETAIDAFRRTGNVAQLGVTVAATTTLFERIGAPEAAATVYGAITGPAGGVHHLADADETAARLAAALGEERFTECREAGARLDGPATVLYVHEQLRRAREAAARGSARSRPGDLSQREVEVLRLVAAGCTTRELADRLFISPKTADHHIQHIYTKIGVSNRAAATRWAVDHDVVA